MRKAIVLAILVVTVALAATPAVFAGDTECTGQMTGTFDGIYVPKGEFCDLVNSTVNGNVKADEGAMLIVDSTTVWGDIQADGAVFVDVHGGYVDGNIQLKNLTEGSWLWGYPGGPETGPHVKGNIQLEGYAYHPDWSIQMYGCIVEGDVQISKNAIETNLENNQVFGNLQCKENDSAPTGSGNVVGGNAEDQCSGLD